MSCQIVKLLAFYYQMKRIHFKIKIRRNRANDAQRPNAEDVSWGNDINTNRHYAPWKFHLHKFSQQNCIIWMNKFISIILFIRGSYHGCFNVRKANKFVCIPQQLSDGYYECVSNINESDCGMAKKIPQNPLSQAKTKKYFRLMRIISIFSIIVGCVVSWKCCFK